MKLKASPAIDLKPLFIVFRFLSEFKLAGSTVSKK